MSLLTDTGALSPTVVGCAGCGREDESCRCRDWGPVVEVEPKDWTVSYFSRALGRTAYAGAMVRSQAVAWGRVMGRGGRGVKTRLLRRLPIPGCTCPRETVYHYAGMRPASRLLKEK